MYKAENISYVFIFKTKGYMILPLENEKNRSNREECKICEI